MKKFSVWPLFMIGLCLFQTASAQGLNMLGSILNGKNRANIAVGVLQNSHVNASAQASDGGRAAAGAVVAAQSGNARSGALNASVGILQNSSVNANAVAKGRNSQAYAGGVIAAAQ